jgi:ABC-2 type transport system permease protein
VTFFILGLTLRQLLFRKSTLLLVGLGFIPVLIAVIFKLSNPDEDPERWTARVLLTPIIVTGVLPLTALMFGVSALGDELEDGTAVYLLTKPLQRWKVLLPKVLAPWLLTSTFVFLATVVSGFIALGELSALTWAFAVASVIGAMAYSAVFVLLSIVTTRALVAGLIYVFLWEGALTGIFEGLRNLSIRHYTLGIAGWLADAAPATFDASLSGTTALILTAVVTLAAAFFANRKLQEVEVREAT